MATRVDDIVADVITELSQVPGVATQLYASGMIRQFVQNAWLLEIEEMWWPDYMVWLTVPLDGTTGSLTQDLVGPISKIDDFGDIAMVFPADRNRRLRALPPGANPFVLTGGGTPGSTGGAFYMSPDYTLPNRPFKVWPNTASGSVVIWARQRNATPFKSDDLVRLDRFLLTMDACWMYAVNDGTVPQQVQKYQQLAHKRRQQMKAAFAQQPLQLDPRFGSSDMIAGDDTSFFVLDQDPLA